MIDHKMILILAPLLLGFFIVGCVFIQIRIGATETRKRNASAIAIKLYAAALLLAALNIFGLTRELPHLGILACVNIISATVIWLYTNDRLNKPMNPSKPSKQQKKKGNKKKNNSK